MRYLFIDYGATHIKSCTYNKEKDETKKNKLRQQLLPMVTQAYRQSNQNKPGFRENMALEFLSTAGSSEEQGFVYLSGDECYQGLESDLLGPTYDALLNGGDIRFTQNEMVIKDINGNECGRLGIRNIRGTPNQDAKISSGCAKERLKKTKSTEVGNSSLRAEDFVRHLKELMQRIDKVRVV